MIHIFSNNKNKQVNLKTGKDEKDTSNDNNSTVSRIMSCLSENLMPIQLFLKLEVRIENLEDSSLIKHIHKLIALSISHFISLNNPNYYRAIPQIFHFIYRSFNPNYKCYSKIKQIPNEIIIRETLRGMSMTSVVENRTPRLNIVDRNVLEIQFTQSNLILIDLDFHLEISTYKRETRHRLRELGFKDIAPFGQKYDKLIREIDRKAKELKINKIDQLMYIYIGSIPAMKGSRSFVSQRSNNLYPSKIIITEID